MDTNLYFKSDQFGSNSALAKYFFAELKALGLNPEEPKDQDYMFIIKVSINDVPVNFYMGKNDEESTPSLWQIWPEQQVSFIKKIFGQVDKNPEEKAKSHLESIVNDIKGVSDIEWSI